MLYIVSPRCTRYVPELGADAFGGEEPDGREGEGLML
jgi:hypothetical protein